MLYTQTVEAGTLDLIKRFMQDEAFKEFRLVGGTALSLYIGHRISIDIDLFCNIDFNSASIGEHLNSNYNSEKTKVLKNGAFSLVDNIKVDLIAHQYPWLLQVNNIDNIRMASIDDIGAMKIHAIVQSGNRLKDFIDIHYLLEHRSLDQLVGAYEKKYPDTNRLLAYNAVVYFNDIDFDVPVKLINQPMQWDKINERLTKSIKNKDVVFKSLTEQKPMLRKKRGHGF